MKFYNREDELRELKLLRETLPSMIVITGRRRVGKTELIKEFLKYENGIYLFVDNKKSERMLLEEYSMQIREAFNLGDYVILKDWENLLELLFDLAKENETIVAFDEFQRFLNINPSFINQLQKYWDLHKDRKVFFILSGSSIGMIKDIFIKQKSPLFKRAQNILFIEPFDFEKIGMVLDDLGITDIKTKIEIYSLFGGIMHYYTLMEHYNTIKNSQRNFLASKTDTVFDTTSIKSILNDLILRKFAPLSKEVSDIMVECFGKEHRTYYSILTAIASGKGTKKEIADFVDVKETSLSNYLYDLADLLGVVQHKVPVTEKKPEKSKKGRYFLKDNFFKFWFRFIYRNMSYYEIGEYEYILRKIEEQFNSFVSFAYEDVCREFLLNANKKDLLPFKFSKIGSWWNRRGDEIDIVALNEETKEILFAECKWREKKVSLKTLNELKEKAKLVQWHNDERKEYYALFSKSGFKEGLREALLFDLDDLRLTFDQTHPRPTVLHVSREFEK
ncbi:MAG: hypothetical protein A7316_01995 [Candidatus Altiarchaeales archaeon WOR_SM1_86-2]|nr:MAG: hypothetical protein A7316_01995 [Candidatus Altiarchaeales archaeon WOR_SM1_86-2]ODS40888.1 MAG: hypothetical protein A7315_07350 [Candidatus Altiarchaeales archaeon WOR_SM1_79]